MRRTATFLRAYPFREPRLYALCDAPTVRPLCHSRLVETGSAVLAESETRLSRKYRLIQREPTNFIQILKGESYDSPNQRVASP